MEGTSEIRQSYPLWDEDCRGQELLEWSGSLQFGVAELVQGASLMPFKYIKKHTYGSTFPLWWRTHHGTWTTSVYRNWRDWYLDQSMNRYWQRARK